MTRLKFPKKKTRKLFDSEKFKNYKKKLTIWLAVFGLSFITIIFVSYVQTFTLIVISAWSLFLLSIYSCLFYYSKIRILKKAKNELFIMLEQNNSMDLIALAQKIEYPYAIFKQIIDYLVQQGELIVES